MRHFRTHLSDRGDTIIEVLIAIAIVSLVLAGAYASTNRNVAVVQDTNERSQAQQLLRKQAELLRDADANGITFTATGGCMTSPSTRGTGTNCDIGYNGAATCDVSFCYHLNIVPTGVSGSAVYQITATWDSLTGDTSSASLVYGPGTAP